MDQGSIETHTHKRACERERERETRNSANAIKKCKRTERIFSNHYLPSAWQLSVDFQRDRWSMVVKLLRLPSSDYYSVLLTTTKTISVMEASGCRHRCPSMMTSDSDRRRFDNLYWPGQHFHRPSGRHRSIGHVWLSIPVHWLIVRLVESNRGHFDAYEWEQQTSRSNLVGAERVQWNVTDYVDSKTFCF